MLSVVTTVVKYFTKVNTKIYAFKFRDNAYFTNLLLSDDNVQKLLCVMNTKNVDKARHWSVAMLMR